MQKAGAKEGPSNPVRGGRGVPFGVRSCNAAWLGSSLLATKGTGCKLHSAMRRKSSRRIAQPEKAGTLSAVADEGLLPRKSILSRAALPGLALLPLAHCHAVPQASIFVEGNRPWRHGWESMTRGDSGTYGTTLRVTPMTDGTRYSIRMANRGTTLEAGVMLRGPVVVDCWLSKFQSGGVCCK